MLDGNITIDSHGDVRGCRSIALIGGCSVPEKHYENGVVHVGVVHENNGPLALHVGSIFFAVCPSEENACLYSCLWEIDLWNDTSNDCKHDCNMTWNHDQSCCQSATCYNKGLCNGSFPTDCNDKNCTLIRYCEICASYCLWGKDRCQVVSCEECLNRKDAYVFKSGIFTVPSGGIKTQRILS